MNKREFLEKFLSLFPLCFNDRNFEHWYSVYECIIPYKFEFELLLKDLTSNIPNLKVAPSPAEVKMAVRRIQNDIDSHHTLEKLEKIKTYLDPPPPEFYEAYFKMCEAMKLKPSEQMVNNYKKTIEEQKGKLNT